MTNLRTGLVALVATPLLVASTAYGFGEDLCYPSAGGALVDCQPLPAACSPVPTSTDACKQAVIDQANTASNSGIYVAGRSEIHVDSTYIMAQALGFSSTDAYWIAAYDGTVDSGNSFVPRSNQSVVQGSNYATAALTGIARADIPSGGILLHFIAPYNNGSTTPPAGIDGLHPNPTNAAEEPTLASYRTWAANGSLGCTAGLTTESASGNYGSGAGCYINTPIKGSLSAIGTTAVPLATNTGPQTIEDPSSGTKVGMNAFASVIATDGAMTTSTTHLADARLGIYLHILADRITHHECTDLATIAGPTDMGFNIDLTNEECTEGWHFLHHVWEQGVEFSLVPTEDLTTEAALSTVYDELQSFAQARKLTPIAGLSKTTLLGQLDSALQQTPAMSRIGAMDAVGCSYDLAVFPGQLPCSSADAGVAAPAAAVSAGSSSGVTSTDGVDTVGENDPHGCDIGGGASGGLTLIAGLFALIGTLAWRRARSA